MIPRDLSQHLSSLLSIEHELVHVALERVALSLEKHYQMLAQQIHFDLKVSLDSQIEAVLEAFLIVLPLKLKSNLLLPSLFHVILSRSEDFIFDAESLKQAYLQFYEEISEKVPQAEIPSPPMIVLDQYHPLLSLDMIEPDLMSIVSQNIHQATQAQQQAQSQIIHLLGTAKTFSLNLILKEKLKQNQRCTPVISSQSKDFFEQVQISLLSGSDLLDLQIEKGEFFLNQKLQGQALFVLIDDFEFLTRDLALNLILLLERANFPITLYIASNALSRDSFYLKKSIEQKGGRYTIYDLKSSQSLLGSSENRDEINQAEMASLPISLQLSLEGFASFAQLPSLSAFEVLTQLKRQMQGSDLASEIFQMTCLLGPIFPVSVLSLALNQPVQIIKAQLDFLSFKFAGVDENEQEYYQFGHFFVWLQAIKQMPKLTVSLDALAGFVHAFFGESQTRLSLTILKRIAFYQHRQSLSQQLKRQLNDQEIIDSFDEIQWIQSKIQPAPIRLDQAPKLYLSVSTLAGLIAQGQPMLWTQVLMVEQAKILSQHAYVWNQVQESIPFLQVAVVCAKSIKAHQDLAAFLLLLSKFYLLIKSPQEALVMIESTYPVLKSLQKDEDLVLCAYYQVDAYLQMSLILSAYHLIHSVLEDQALSYLWQIRFLVKKAEIERAFTQLDHCEQTLTLAQRLWMLIKPADQKKERAVEFNLIFQKLLLLLKLKQWKDAQKLKQKLSTFGLEHFTQSLISLSNPKIDLNFDLNFEYKEQVIIELKNTQYAHLALIHEGFELKAIFEHRQNETWPSLAEEISWRNQMIDQMQAIIQKYEIMKDYLAIIPLKLMILAWQSALFKIHHLSFETQDHSDLALLRSKSLEIFKQMIELIALSQDLNLPERFDSIKLEEIPLFIKNDQNDIISFAIQSLYRLNSLEELEAQYLVIRQHEIQ